MSNTFDKLSVLDSFIEEVNSYLPEIESNLERLTQFPGDMDALEETYRRTHTIGGSASMMDFPGLAHVAHGMEDILCDVMDGLTTLNEPTTGLLQRSCGRLRLLLNGIRSSVDDKAIIAEDDDDYERYRATLTAPAQMPTYVAEEQVPSHESVPPPVASSGIPSFDVPNPIASSMPSFDEVLASFRTPVVSEDEEIAWPEEPALPLASAEFARASEARETLPSSSPSPSFAPVSLPQVEASERVQPVDQSEVPTSSSLPVPQMPPTPPATPSALEELVASTRVSSSQFPSVQPDAEEQKRQLPVSLPQPVPEIVPSLQHSEEKPSTTALPQVYEEMQSEARTLEIQASSLKNVLAQLRSTMSVIEIQRKEFKGFLDGSKDALDRMEDWAGRAMGLNLRNSPEQVRRYLPLSVMWVANSKLKKILDILHTLTSGVEVTDEQMHLMVQQLQSSIVACGEAFQQMQANAGLTFPHEQGWTPWEMQVSREADVMRERVTFERRGDIATLRAEIEASVREELQREYEGRSSSARIRAELEQQIRDEVRHEFEARQRKQEEVSRTLYTESQDEMEARVRSDIEIQVRQDFLDQLTSAGIDLSALSRGTPHPLMLPPTPAPTTSNFADHAREATGLATQDTLPSAPLHSSPPVTQTRIAPSAQQSTEATRPVVSASSEASSPPIVPRQGLETSSTTSSIFTGDFSEEAAEIFRLEAEEHLQTISVHVAALEKDPTNKELIQGVRRATHTLKGAAGMMGFRAIADLCHVSEDLLDSIMEGNTAITPAVLSIILDTAEALDILINGRGDQASDEARVNALRTRYAALLGEQTAPYDPVDEDIDVDSDSSYGSDPITDAKLVAGVLDSEQAGQSQRRVAPGDLSVRVRLQKLDELVNLFGELLVNRSVLEERVQRLLRLVADVGVSSNRLRDVGQRLESGFEAATLPSGRSVQVMPGEGKQNGSYGGYVAKNGRNGVEPSHLAEFDELELDRYTEFHRLARGLSEGISDMTTLSTEMDAIIRECESVFSRENRLSTTFQDRLMKVRLVPLVTMAPRLYRAARAVALKQHKDFEFLLEGEETEVDRTVFEEVAGPLLHLMRNAVNHAIETPEVRIQRGKSPIGQIKLAAFYEGNQVVISVQDDGNGIDREHVREIAIARGLIRPDQLLNENDLIELIFRPGFSTAEVLSEESGRGVGLDVVRDSVSRLRGTIEVESMPGQGTTFTMKFPTSLAIQSAMMVMVSGQQYAIPTSMVESIGRLDTYKRTTLAGQPAITVRNDIYPLQMLSHYLALPQGSIEEKSPILLVNAGGHRIALVIDEVKGKLEIVTKSLGPHLRHIHGIAGATVLGNGRVVLILELTELLSTRSRIAATVPRREMAAAPSPQTTTRQSVSATLDRQNAPARPATSSTPERGKHVLIVDDSPSVRRVVGNMLKQRGWEVQMARDGVEALEMISRETPAAVLLDIEMPRMDGYELTATVRSQEQYRTLPLIVLTSRAAAKHQQRAMQLGASAYVVKPYQDEELLNLLNSLVYGAVIR